MPYITRTWEKLLEKMGIVLPGPERDNECIEVARAGRRQTHIIQGSLNFQRFHSSLSLEHRYWPPVFDFPGVHSTSRGNDPTMLF